MPPVAHEDAEVTARQRGGLAEYSSRVKRCRQFDRVEDGHPLFG